MWAKIGQIISQYLLLPLLKDLVLYVKDYFQRKSEQKKRHQENAKKVKKYEDSPSSASSDDFSQLP
jgi:hypothetical protein